MNGLYVHRNLSGTSSRGHRQFLLGTCLLAAATFARAASGTTLEQLFEGSSVDVGNSQFSDWQLVSLDSTTILKPDLSQIEVEPLANDFSNPGMQFDANGQLSIVGINSIDLEFRFRVHVLAGGNDLTNDALALSGIRFGSSGGLAIITDEASDRSGNNLGPTLVVKDEGSNFTQSHGTSAFAPQSDVFVVTSVSIHGQSTADEINLASFTQGFAQTGPAILPGDYNQDGAVDTADYVVWRDHLGEPAGTLPNDVDGGPIGQAQYDTWRAKFGNTELSASAALRRAAVHEPSSWLLLAIASAGLIGPIRRVVQRRDCDSEANGGFYSGDDFAAGRSEDVGQDT
jgi:hypothetical protein